MQDHQETVPKLGVVNKFLNKRTEFLTGIGQQEAYLYKLWLSRALTLSIKDNAHTPLSAAHGAVTKTMEQIH